MWVFIIESFYVCELFACSVVRITLKLILLLGHRASGVGDDGTFSSTLGRGM